MKYITIIGTVGVPANYGGFETLVENVIGENASKDGNYTVYCSSKSYPKRLSLYKALIPQHYYKIFFLST